MIDRDTCRPVSLTSVVGKLMEGILTDIIYLHLKRTDGDR